MDMFPGEGNKDWHGAVPLREKITSMTGEKHTHGAAKSIRKAWKKKTMENRQSDPKIPLLETNILKARKNGGLNNRNLLFAVVYFQGIC